MACFSPLTAWQTVYGEIVFKERGDLARSLQLACGQCIGCRRQRAQVWAVRCMHEAQMHSESCFVTLTYDDEKVPRSLEYKDFQDFMKRLRKRCGKVRFFMCGEYGDKYARPHFHACLFGVAFGDRVLFSGSDGSAKLYRSPLLESLWTFGFSTIGEVTIESAQYVAAYCVKKVTGARAAAHYTRVCGETGEVYEVEPEFASMSLRPGIGDRWIRKFLSDVYSGAHDGVVFPGGVRYAAPRYYDRVLKEVNPDLYEEIQLRRYQAITPDRVSENQRERLVVREKVVKAGLALKSRNLE